MSTRKSAIADLAWEPAVIRLTAFFKKNELPEQNWWADVLGSPAENRTIKPLDDISEGNLLNGRLLLSTNPIRADWRLSVPNEFTDEYGIATLGSFQNNIEAFTNLMEKWLQLRPKPAISRLAFGLMLLQPVDSLTKGYEILEPFLKSVTVDIQDSSDLLYQINRPRAAKTDIKDLKVINRLTKWAVLRLNATLFTNTTPVTVEIPEKFAAMVEMDINTDKEFQGVLTANKLPKLFNELTGLATEIAESGDIK